MLCITSATDQIRKCSSETTWKSPQRLLRTCRVRVRVACFIQFAWEQSTSRAAGCMKTGRKRDLTPPPDQKARAARRGGRSFFHCMESQPLKCPQDLWWWCHWSVVIHLERRPSITTGLLYQASWSWRRGGAIQRVKPMNRPPAITWRHFFLLQSVVKNKTKQEEPDGALDVGRVVFSRGAKGPLLHSCTVFTQHVKNQMTKLFFCLFFLLSYWKKGHMYLLTCMQNIPTARLG